MDKGNFKKFKKNPQPKKKRNDTNHHFALSTALRTLTAPIVALDLATPSPIAADMFHPHHQSVPPLPSGYVPQAAIPPLTHVGMLNPAAAGPPIAAPGPKRSAYVTSTVPTHPPGRVFSLPSHLATRQRLWSLGVTLAKLWSDHC